MKLNYAVNHIHNLTGEEVVAVHNHVNETVEEPAECCVSSPHKLEQSK